MIQILPKLYIGNYDDAKPDKVFINEINCIFNVSDDLDLVYDLDDGKTRYPKIFYSKIGLIDGKGNKPGTLCAVGLHLYSLTKSEEGYNILVCCHGGRSRSPAAICLYMALFWGYDLEISLTFLRRKDIEIAINGDLLKEMNEVMPKLAEMRTFQHQ